MTNHFFRAFTLISILSFNVLAQLPAANTDSPDASKEEKQKARVELESKAFRLIEQVASDATGLKLAENRAYVLAMTADLLWKQDPKRARALFRSAANELVTANVEAKTADNDEFGARFGNSLRHTILQTIAHRDADLALELLVQTRSPEVAAEMAKAALPQTPVDKQTEKTVLTLFGDRNARFHAQEELRLEQSFATLAAGSDPQRAAKILRESFTRGVTSEVLSSLSRISAKDSALANQLLIEAANKLLDADFSQRQQLERNLAIAILQQYGQLPTTLKRLDTKRVRLTLDDKTSRDLANKLADNALRSANNLAFNPDAHYQITQLLPVVQKTSPERAAQLKQKQLELSKTLPRNMRAISTLRSLDEPNTAPEKIIGYADQMPQHMRQVMYRRVADNLANKGEIERAKQLLSNAPAGKERDAAVAYVDAKLAEKAAREGKYDEARRIIAGINSKTQQVEQTVKLALIFYAKNDQDNRETAVKLMDEARAMIAVNPQSDDEVQQLMQVAAGFAAIEPTRAFALIEPFVDLTNDLIGAAALLAKYQRHQFLFRDGELLLNAGVGQAHQQMRFVRELKLLAAADFERTSNLADKFQRDDVRILARLLIAQSLLKDIQVLDDGVFDGRTIF